MKSWSHDDYNQTTSNWYQLKEIPSNLGDTLTYGQNYLLRFDDFLGHGKIGPLELCHDMGAWEIIVLIGGISPKYMRWHPMKCYVPALYFTPHTQWLLHQGCKFVWKKKKTR